MGLGRHFPVKNALHDSLTAILSPLEGLALPLTANLATYLYSI